MLRKTPEFSLQILFLLFGASISWSSFAAPSREDTKQYIEQLVDKYCTLSREGSESKRSVSFDGASLESEHSLFENGVHTLNNHSKASIEELKRIELSIWRKKDISMKLFFPEKSVQETSKLRGGDKAAPFSRWSNTSDKIILCSVIKTKKSNEIALKLAKAIQHYSSFYGEPAKIIDFRSPISEDLF